MKFVNYHMIFCVLLNVTVGLRAIDHISINCGGAAAAEGLGGRQWLRDAAAKGSSTVITAVEPARYETARISRSKFSYSFRLNPGQKSIRLHFNPSSYDQFESLNDLFTVEAGPYSLLANFSASITARALAVDVIVREFCIITKEDETLDLVFSPENKNYAIINRIEIISAPSTTVSYCHGGDTGARVIGQKPLINVDNTTALERVHYRHIKWGSASSDDDIGSMFGMWGSASSSLKKNTKTWRVSVDMGFKYLVRVHLCDVGLEMDFVLLIDNIIVLTSAELRQQREKEQNMLWYNNYMVMEEAGEEEEKRDISITLHSRHEFLDRHGPLEGFEVFKLSNHDHGLASPSPLLKRRDSQQISLPLLRALLYNLHLYISPLKYDILYAYTIYLICMIVTVINLEQKISVDNFTKELEMPLARVKQPCCLFSLPEVQSALENFHDGRVLGRGKSGKVYKRHMDNGIEVVEIKRSKPCFKQWEHRFWTKVAMLSYLFWIEVAMLSYRFRTVVAMLSELLRVNLVFFIEDCRFVCGYMLYRIFGDYIYRLARESDDFCHLSWKQDRDICIGASRVLDYLHMGHGILPIDLKASTMLLDKNLDPKVSDFGLAKIGRGGLTISQHIKKFEGSSEYQDAILFGTSYQTEKIYSFGALVLEIMCGRPVPPWNEQDKDSLITWAIKYKGQVDHIVAPSLRGQISPKPNSLKTFLKIAEGPLHDEPKKRPGTAEILRKLAYALPQQEKAESVAMKERNGLASLLLSTILTSREKNMDDDLSSFTFVGVWDTFRDYETDSLLGLQCSGKIHKGFNYVASSLLGVRCPWKIHTGFHYKASYDKPGIRKCFPGKKLNSESVESNLVWQERSVGRVSCLDVLNLFSCYSNASELFTKDSLENLRRGVSVQSLPLDIELKTLFVAARAVESKRRTLFGAARAVESKRKTLFRAARAVESKIKNFYRDFKASNILLDGISDSFCSPPSFLFETNKSYLAELADFSLMKIGPTAGHSHFLTQVMGTYGYVAPECFATGRWYMKMADPKASGPHVITPVVEIYHTINPNATGEYDNTLFGSEIERNHSNKACGCTECYCWALILG